jgi:hypothetical protein
MKQRTSDVWDKKGGRWTSGKLSFLSFKQSHQIN